VSSVAEPGRGPPRTLQICTRQKTFETDPGAHIWCFSGAISATILAIANTRGTRDRETRGTRDRETRGTRDRETRGTRDREYRPFSRQQIQGGCEAKFVTTRY
jgi:hypothetical protein